VTTSDIVPDVDLADLFSGLGGVIFQSIRLPLGIFSRDHRILWLNRGLARIHRCHAERVIGQTCYQAFYGCDKVCRDCFLEETLTSGRTVVLERSHVFPGGRKRWGEIHAYPIRNREGRVNAAVVIIFETTERVRQLARQKAYTDFLSARILGSDGSGRDSRKGVSLPSSALTRREREVLRLIVDGYSNPQISEMLSISANTVKRHVSNLFLKLDVTDRTQAAVRAIRLLLV